MDKNITGDVFQTPVRDETPSAHELCNGLKIDFHSAEFNCTDCLDDLTGNYRFFESLDTIATAHERRQTEQACDTVPVDPQIDEAAPSHHVETKSESTQPSLAAESLTVISKGRTLIIGTDAERVKACATRLTGRELDCTLLVTKGASRGPAIPRLSRFALLQVDSASITGAFGKFSATVVVNGKRKPLTGWAEGGAATFDLILDLQPEPSFVGDRLPAGYYAPGPDSAALEEVLAELPGMRGRFRKPLFVSFHKDRCWHGRSRRSDCSHCLDICLFGAIQSADRKVSIDHLLCQGCGACALVCPADALQVTQPSQQEMLGSLQAVLQDFSPTGARGTTLVISDSLQHNGDAARTATETSNDRRVYFQVEEMAHVRLEMLLAALLLGARDVVVACGPQNPAGIREAVECQVRMVRAILQGIGLSEDRCRFILIPSDDIDSHVTDFESTGFYEQTNNGVTVLPSSSPAKDESITGCSDRRALVRQAAQHLYDLAGAREPSLSLPAGSPFGTVVINGAACTLCMACVAACPSGALSTSGNGPGLMFQESQCHQCGLCKETCPEGAIRLLPRLLCDPEAVEARMTLHETEPMRCIECGEPFASQAMLNRVAEKLKGHWMYASERQLRRLKMCRTCSARDALTSKEMQSWNVQ